MRLVVLFTDLPEGAVRKLSLLESTLPNVVFIDTSN
jgi:hypothetical protein